MSTPAPRVRVLSHDTQINVLSTHQTREMALDALRQLQEHAHWRDMGVRVYQTSECDVAYCLPRGATGVAS